MQINRKKIIVIVSVCLLAVTLGALYIWYTNNYGNMKRISIPTESSLDYEWQSIASQNNLTVDYLWSRTTELMLDNASDGTLIPSTLMIEGRLVTEEQEESGVYKLSDQALLLRAYVKSGDRFKASSLVSAVENYFDFESESNYEKESWLLAFIEYYNVYGKKDDYSKIVSMVGHIFDEEGNLRAESLSVASYNDNGYVSTVDLPDDDGHSTTEEIPGAESSSTYNFEGVTLSSINLKLIRILEDNNLIPVGSFERNKELVLNGVVSDNIRLYAYAYEILDDGTISYINAHRCAAAIDVYESILTMRNLSEVNLLPDNIYIALKNMIINNPNVKDTYYIITGQYSDTESVDSYVEILNIAVNMEDLDLFTRIIPMIGGRVATYNNSPALSMVYRSVEDRYIFYARENLEITILLK